MRNLYSRRIGCLILAGSLVDAPAVAQSIPAAVDDGLGIRAQALAAPALWNSFESFLDVVPRFEVRRLAGEPHLGAPILLMSRGRQYRPHADISPKSAYRWERENRRVENRVTQFLRSLRFFSLARMGPVPSTQFRRLTPVNLRFSRRSA